jgi:flagellar secretion chaperone FliS
MSDPARAYRESAVRGASPVGLIVILYEEIIHSMRKAQRELQSGNIEQRTRSLNHAIAVVGHLQGILNFEKGGRVASDLSLFYDLVRGKILDASVRTDGGTMEWIVTECSKIKQAWELVDRQVSASGDTAEEVPVLAVSGRQKNPQPPRAARAHTR